MSVFPYILSRTFTNIRGNWLSHLITALTIAFVTAIFGASALIYLNIHRLAQNLSREINVVAYLDPGISPQEVVGLKTAVAKFKDVAGVRHISNNEAFQRLAAQFQGEENLLTGLGQNFLPQSLEIELAEGQNNISGFRQLAGTLKPLHGISDIRYGKEWVEKLEGVEKFAQLLTLVIGAFLLIAVVFIIYSTIKLTTYLRRQELETMRLIGATSFFITGPFILEGALQGLIGSGLALTTLYGVFNLTMAQVQLPNLVRLFNPIFLPSSYVAAIMVGSIILCIIGSLLSTRQFLRI